MKENIDIWDFSLTPEELDEITVLSLDNSTIINHFDSEIVKMLVIYRNKVKLTVPFHGSFLFVIMYFLVGNKKLFPTFFIY